MLAGMGLLSAIGIEITRQDPTENYSLQSLIVDGTLISAATLGDRARVAIPAVFRGQQLLSDMCAQLPWAGIRGGKHSDGSRLERPQALDRQPAILTDPSPFMERDEVVRTIVANLIFRGFAPLYLQQLDRDGRPRFATPINPDEVHASWNFDRTRVEYRWREQLMVPGIDFAVIELQRLPGEPRGAGPFDSAANALTGIDNANTWARDLFADAAMPSGFLQVPGKLNKTEATKLRTQWEEQHQNGRGTAILSGGMAYQATQLTPEQAQFILTRAFGIQEIARLLGVPAHFLNAGNPPQSGQSLTYTNVQSVFRELTTVTLYPTYLRRLEAAFSNMLPRGQSVAFDLSDFVKADDGNRFEAYRTAIDAGVMTVDEAREREGLPALTMERSEV